MPFDTASSTSCVTWWDLSSERCVGIGNAPSGGGVGAGGAACSWRCCDERAASGGDAWDLLIFGICAVEVLRRLKVAAAPDIRRGSSGKGKTSRYCCQG